MQLHCREVPGVNAGSRVALAKGVNGMTQSALLERRAVTRNGEAIFLVITTLFRLCCRGGELTAASRK